MDLLTSFARWQKAPRDWGAFAEYNAAVAQFVQKASAERLRSRIAGGLEDKLQEIVDEEMRHTRFRQLNEAEWFALIDQLSVRLSEVLAEEFRTQVKGIYLSGVKDTYHEAGRPVPVKLGALHDSTLAVLEGPGLVSNVFAGYNELVGNKLKACVVDAFKRGQVDVGSIAQAMTDIVGWETRSKMEMVARSETFKVFETARMNTYEEMEHLFGEKFLYRFGNVHDARTCAMCNNIMDRVGEGVPLEELKKIIIEMSTTPPYGNVKWDPVRGGTFPLPHPGCRHSHFRSQSWLGTKSIE